MSQPTDAITTFAEVKDRLEKFSAERGWDKQISPSKLAVSISIEAAELLEHFQWDAQRDDEVSRAEWAAELADIMIYCLEFANITGIDVSAAIHAKMARNAQKYPITQFNPDSNFQDAYWAVKKQHRANQK